eukprot:1176496-Prorocentrum_minimum.AAC.1
MAAWGPKQARQSDAAVLRRVLRAWQAEAEGAGGLDPVHPRGQVSAPLILQRTVLHGTALYCTVLHLAVLNTRPRWSAAGRGCGR